MNQISSLLMEAVSLEYRKQLRQSLVERRGISSIPGDLSLECGVCHTLIEGMFKSDMHEALITRGHVQTQPQFSHLVFHRCNVVFRHKTCPGGQFTHAGGTGGKDVFTRCLRYLVRYEGKNDVFQYIRDMASVFIEVMWLLPWIEEIDLTKEQKIFEMKGVIKEL